MIHTRVNFTRWRSDQVVKKSKTVMNKRLAKVGTIIKKKFLAESNVKYPPASNPGDYPAKRSGDLRKKTKRILDKRGMRVIIGSDVLGKTSGQPYADFLTTGTRTMKPRKMFPSAMAESKDEWLPLLINGTGADEGKGKL